MSLVQHTPVSSTTMAVMTPALAGPSLTADARVSCQMILCRDDLADGWHVASHAMVRHDPIAAKPGIESPLLVQRQPVAVAAARHRRDGVLVPGQRGGPGR